MGEISVNLHFQKMNLDYVIFSLFGWKEKLQLALIWHAQQSGSSEQNPRDPAEQRYLTMDSLKTSLRSLLIPIITQMSALTVKWTWTLTHSRI